MDVRDLRRRCEARLRDVDLPVPFDVRTFADRLGARRGRPIVLYAASGQCAPHGAWLASPSIDVIFFQEATSPLHQLLIILHELSHLLCDHSPVPVAEADLVRVLFPSFRVEAIQSVLERDAYSTADEREAELLASIILERVTSTVAPDREWLVGDEATLRRIAAHFGNTNT